MTDRTDPVDTAIRTYVGRQLLAREALDNDPQYRAHVEWLRRTLTALHDAMNAEHVPPHIRDRIVHRVLYGAAPNEDEAMARITDRQRCYEDLVRKPLDSKGLQQVRDMVAMPDADGGVR